MSGNCSMPWNGRRSLQPSGVLDAGLFNLAVGPVETQLEAPTEGVLTLEEMERRHIRQTLARTRGRVYGAGGAAELLGLKPSTLQSRMKKLGLERLE